LLLIIAILPDFGISKQLLRSFHLFSRDQPFLKGSKCIIHWVYEKQQNLVSFFFPIHIFLFTLLEIYPLALTSHKKVLQAIYLYWIQLTFSQP
jgi:hypothetical protein